MRLSNNKRNGKVSIFSCATSGVRLVMNWLKGHKKATKQAKVSNRQLQTESLPSFWAVERWKIVDTLSMFHVFVFPSKRVMKSVKRKKYIHTSYIVHNSVDSLDSWQKSRALGDFLSLMCPRTPTFCICINMAKSVLFLLNFL